MHTGLDVAVGVIARSDEVLIARRGAGVDQANLWEFPGGKRESGESFYHALCRELHEELGILVVKAHSFFSIWHQYPRYSVMLNIFLVQEFSGTPVGREGQPVCWVSRERLSDYQFPEANAAIIAALAAKCATQAVT
jgi:8-oxo-dGTP diphosphatase